MIKYKVMYKNPVTKELHLGTAKEVEAVNPGGAKTIYINNYLPEGYRINPETGEAFPLIELFSMVYAKKISKEA